MLAGTENITIPRKITLHASDNIALGNFFLMPSFIVQQQASMFQSTYGAMIVYHEVGSGIWLREDQYFRFSSINYAIRFDTKPFIIVYSYDLSLRNSPYWQNFGAHEVTILVKLKYKEQRKKNRRAVKCPTF